MFRELGRIRVRLLVVNVVVLLVPVVGLEFARIHERQLLEALERDMRNQASLVRAFVERDLTDQVDLGDPRHANILTTAAARTRTRIRLIDATGAVLADSHEHGPPEGPEPPPPSLVPRSIRENSGFTRDYNLSRGPKTWPEIPDRPEVRKALEGHPASMTRIRDRHPDVLLFITEPIRNRGRVVGAAYLVRSTQPVLVELHRIRTGLVRVLAVALLITGTATLLLAWSISRPLGRLSRAARRVAEGEPDVSIPVSGGGEIEELGASFARMKDQLDARLRFIQDFAADVAHEFKSPLTSLRGAAELLEEGADDDPEARRRFLRNITLDVERLDRLVSRLLELSRIEASREPMTDIDLPALLQRVVDRASTPDQPVVLHPARISRRLLARATDLEAALLNLAENAVRFSPTGQPVEITVRDHDPTASIHIVVEDHGPGIPPTNLARIFDRFFTTDEARDGTGLGLAIVQSVAQAHGGRVHVESRWTGDVPEGAPTGATFTLELPTQR
ncbi:ATP-binding protein [Chondromyces crocatus]|uniref:ATP-binding protein n=1 Tax=Chondromyces crocatus TaxID=52 RepID=UPI001FE2276B|nr:ATP-binding protein [Chondromyces crocatus]